MMVVCILICTLQFDYVIITKFKIVKRGKKRKNSNPDALF